MKEKILVVEDERIIACDIKDCLEMSGYIVPAISGSGEKAIEQATKLQPDLVLMDVKLKGNMNGVQAAEIIINSFNIPVVFLTAYSDEITLKKAKLSQPFGYILKPFEESQLITTIEIALNRHQNEVVMRNALQKEIELREVKSRFFSMMSHEFRNPLSTILTSSELLSHHQQLSEIKTKEYLAHIQSSVKEMDNLLSDLLLIGKSESGKYEFNPQPLTIEDFCQELIEEINFRNRDKYQIVLTWEAQCIKEDSTNQFPITKTRLPCLDKKLLRHILNNLLTNAIKYSPQDSIINFDIFCKQKEVVFRIQDEGIGIPEIDQENMFNCFHRAINVGKIPGHGLGLAIVKQYVELHDGEITVVSKEGVGTTFIVTLPIRYQDD